MKKLFMIGVLALAGMFASSDADARSRVVTCYVSGVGSYPCTFTPLRGDGSFRISARGRDTIYMYMEGNGSAWGERTIARTGRTAYMGGYFRVQNDRACWEHDENGTRICAR
jgi:hypothetical protein